MFRYFQAAHLIIEKDTTHYCIASFSYTAMFLSNSLHPSHVHSQKSAITPRMMLKV